RRHLLHRLRAGRSRGRVWRDDGRARPRRGPGLPAQGPDRRDHRRHGQPPRRRRRRGPAGARRGVLPDLPGLREQRLHVSVPRAHVRAADRDPRAAAAGALRASRVTRARLVTWVPAAIAIVILVILPLISSDFFTSTIGVRSLWLGIAASSLIFLSGYGGM